ncbi:MAG: DUF3817 domain-containing protein [Myxococcota bacterium]
MEPLVLWRLCKFVGVALFTTGVIGSVVLPSQRQRRVAAQVVATIGLIAVWIAGYAMLKQLGLTLKEPWVSRALLAGLLAMGGAAWSAGAARVPPVAGAVAFGGLIAAFGLMSARTGSVVFGTVLPGIVAALTFGALVRAQPGGEPDAEAPAATFRWFAWLARAEGLSLLLLFGLYIPMKYLADIVLDGGQGWFGWAHGVLQLLYLVALLAAGRAHGWSIVRLGFGFVASLVPFGTFVFEARVRPSEAPSAAE